MGFAGRLTAAVGRRGSTRAVVVGGRGSSSSVYRGYYCFYEADGAVLVEEFVLSTAPGKLEEQY